MLVLKHATMVQSREKDPNKQHPPRKLRSACDVCHQAKTKCTGGTPFDGTPCTNCRDSGYQCRFSVSNRIGRPRGTKNKRTLDRMSLHQRGGSDQSEPEPSFPRQAHSLTTSLNNNAGRSMTPPLAETPIDSVLDTSIDGFHTLTEFSALDPFSDDPTSWYDFDDLAETSPFMQQPPCIRGFVDNEPRPFSQVYSAYVSPTSLYNDMESFQSGPDLSDLFGNMKSDAEEHQNMTALSSSWSIASSTTCNCVQNHAELLCHLREIEQRHLRTRLDVILSSVQQALIHWKCVLECRICQHNGNQEVLMLSATSILTVLRSLQCLCSEYYNTLAFSQHTEGQEWAMVDTLHGMQSVIGTYEVTEEGRTAVEELLIVRTLDKMRYTMTSFKGRLERLETKKNASSITVPCQISHSDQVNGDLNNLVQVWWDLNSTVQMLERVLEVSKVKSR
ncbi:hypothetical protein N7G274_000748 [Stereocaulon virgatum]|uniref:Zn(2)-C6 fungal-type domain-containing protein n=1 Tax=Stereocaulon virgatum TaxID=373712 RepID=A0ABR4AS83_9LECA